MLQIADRFSYSDQLMFSAKKIVQDDIWLYVSMY